MRSFLSSMTATALAAVLVILSAAGIAAQSSTGSLRGQVKDAQGVIPGATVAIVNDANGVARETVTNESGEYSFPALEPAAYTVKVGVPGFRTFERKGVRVATQAALSLDITLEVGSLEETITVTADAPLIETANASTGGVIDTAALEQIPTAGRSVMLMANLEPTVQASGNAHWNRMQDQTGNSAISMGGGAVRGLGRGPRPLAAGRRGAGGGALRPAGGSGEEHGQGQDETGESAIGAQRHGTSSGLGQGHGPQSGCTLLPGPVARVWMERPSRSAIEISQRWLRSQENTRCRPFGAQEGYSHEPRPWVICRTCRVARSMTAMSKPPASSRAV